MDEMYEVTLEIVDSEIDMNLDVNTSDVETNMSLESNDIEAHFEVGDVVVGGTKNYEELYNRPTFNGVDLKGDMKLDDVGGVDEENYMSLEEIDHLFKSL